MNDDERRLRIHAHARSGGEAWYRITNAAGSTTAQIDIYDEIGGWFGTSAADFVGELRALPDTVDRIELHLNSPGGDVFEGLAILNALRQHPARVVVTVDGLAASAASFIAQAGAERVMARNSEMMIHDAQGFGVGNADLMRDLADRLDKVSDNIADVYASRAGGSIAGWRAAMAAETWYSDAEAVDAGLADSVLPVDDEATVSNKQRFDFAVFNYAGRRDAPAPAMPSHEAQSHNPDQRGVRMDSAEQREALGLPPDASDDEVRAAAAETFGLTPADPNPDAGDTDGTGGTDAEDAVSNVRRGADGSVTIDAAAWEAQQERIRALERQQDRQRAAERDQVIDDAVRAGKFPPPRADHWRKLWDRDPEGIRDAIAHLKAGVVPVDSIGYDGDLDGGWDDEFRNLFPPHTVTKGN